MAVFVLSPLLNCRDFSELDLGHVVVQLKIELAYVLLQKLLEFRQSSTNA